MDPTHLVHPPRAHPSGSMNGIHSGPHGGGVAGEGGHFSYHPNGMPDDAATTTTQRKSTNVVHETWFMALVITMLLAILISAAAAMLFFKRRHQLTKELGHLSGEFYFLFSSFRFFSIRKLFKLFVFGSFNNNAISLKPIWNLLKPVYA